MWLTLKRLNPNQNSFRFFLRNFLVRNKYVFIGRDSLHWMLVKGKSWNEKGKAFPIHWWRSFLATRISHLTGLGNYNHCGWVFWFFVHSVSILWYSFSNYLSIIILYKWILNESFKWIKAFMSQLFLKFALVLLEKKINKNIIILYIKNSRESIHFNKRFLINLIITLMFWLFWTLKL